MSDKKETPAPAEDPREAISRAPAHVEVRLEDSLGMEIEREVSQRCYGSLAAKLRTRTDTAAAGRLTHAVLQRGISTVAGWARDVLSGRDFVFLCSPVCEAPDDECRVVDVSALRDERVPAHSRFLGHALVVHRLLDRLGLRPCVRSDGPGGVREIWAHWDHVVPPNAQEAALSARPPHKEPPAPGTDEDPMLP